MTTTSSNEHTDASSPSSSPPPSFHDIDRWRAHIGLREFGEGLQAAAKAVFPNEQRSRYTKVFCLMLYWEDEDPNLPVSLEVSRLCEVFGEIYGFETEVWKIPDQSSHVKVNLKVLEFVMTGGDSKEHLKIVYYAGHGKLTRNRLLSWTRYYVSCCNKKVVAKN
jgi:hypothetical protein